MTFCNSSYSLGAFMFSGAASIKTLRQFLLTDPVVHRTIIAKTKVQIGSTILIPGFPFWKKYIIHAARSTPHDCIISPSMWIYAAWITGLSSSFFPSLVAAFLDLHQGWPPALCPSLSYLIIILNISPQEAMAIMSSPIISWGWNIRAMASVISHTVKTQIMRMDASAPMTSDW